ncbi:MAG: hypothetical protein EA357_07085 [Micavibrio sp.]|nr:MAG: hypothetical protein EA357_07085 [Micavibrio sp.]
MKPENQKNGKYPEWKKSEWYTPKAVYSAASQNNTELLGALIEGGETLQRPSSIGWTPLMYAVHSGAKEAVEILLRHGADPDQGKANDGDDTPLMLAAEGGHTEIIELLLNAGAKIDKPNDHGTTPLMTAVHWKQSKAVRLLLDKGAKPDLQTKTGDTALMAAADNSCEEAARILLYAGADPSLTNAKGETVKDIAEKRGKFHAGARIIQQHLKGSSREMKQRRLRSFIRRRP